ncbi:MAG: DUF5680 domain-containing protein [Bacillota bacterium]
MILNTDDFKSFLVKAKISTYAGYGDFSPSSRPESKDLHYRDKDYLYIDTYLGGIEFAGEEAVWMNNHPVWSMNYYGRMLVDQIPEGFSDFLKEALRNVPYDAPFRGPEKFVKDSFVYNCSYNGKIDFFVGKEVIYMDDKPVYELVFHGGSIK